MSELVDGPSAREVVDRGPLSVPAALWIAEDVARALVAASAAGVVHRDVKPSNVLITPEGVAKLCDFGIAKDLQSTLRTLTASGAGMGTLAYLAPEQASQAKHVDARADLYALGATLYHLLAGRPPFRPRGADALLALVEQPPPPLGAARPDCPPEVARLVHAMLAKRPEERPPLWGVPDQLRALREHLAPGVPRSRPTG
jgi:serine/threonine-protein kinase